MTKSKGSSSWTTDFLAARPQPQSDAEAIQRRESANLLDSYSRAMDFLAEAVQNATDALDMRTAREPNAPRRILITFDRSRGRFSVADTGIGMSKADLQLVLSPNVTLKSGPLARQATGRSRGYKGVGLTFLALGANYLQIQTCDGRTRKDLVVRDGNRWLQDEVGGTHSKPMAQGNENQPDRLLGSDRYTVVTVGDINSELFDENLFDYDADQLSWALRTKTAIGNTRPIFGEKFGAPLEPSEDVSVSLRYIDSRGKGTRAQAVPYRYASPEELLPSRVVVDVESLRDTTGARLSAVLAGKALRYRRTFITLGGRNIDMYAFAMDAREFDRRARRLIGAKRFAPDHWQGFWVATRGMPANIEFPPLHIQPRTYERRIFALLQYDELILDMGRKTLVGRTTNMFRGVVKQAWQEDLTRYVPRLSSLTPEGEVTTADAQLRSRIQEALKGVDLKADVPYLKQPVDWAGVMALFHELLAAGNHLPRLRTLRTGVFTDDRDALVYVGDPNGVAPMRVVFGHGISEVLATLEGQETGAETAGLAVVWDADVTSLAARDIDVVRVENDPRGATHIVRLHGLLDLEELPVIALKAVLASS